MMSTVLGTIPAVLEGTEEFSIHSLGSSHQLCLVASHKNAVLQRNLKSFTANSHRSILQTGQHSHQKTFQGPRGWNTATAFFLAFCLLSPAYELSSSSTLIPAGFSKHSSMLDRPQACSEQSLGSGLLVQKSSWLQALPVPDVSLSNPGSSLQCTCPESVL